VEIAEDGQSAVDKTRERVYDLVLMDVQMPVMDGLMATRLIRAMPGRGAMPIVAMTANAFDEDREACLAVGMNDHVVKPVDPEELYRAFLRWLPDPAATAQSSEARLAEAHEQLAGPSPERSLDQSTRSVAAMPEGEAEACRARLASIEGLDLAAGLRATHHRLDLYRRLLARFLETRDPSRLRQALDRIDLDEARRAVHTLKGVAATLGATRLRGLAARLEQEIATGTAGTATLSRWTSQAESIAAETRRLQWALRLALTWRAEPASDPDALGAPLDTATLGVLTAQLEALLEAGDMQAVDVLRSGRSLLDAACGDQAGPLAALIEDFAFDEALAQLRRVMRSWSARPGHPGD
jgi:CheY-like chemotaxis protein